MPSSKTGIKFLRTPSLFQFLQPFGSPKDVNHPKRKASHSKRSDCSAKFSQSLIKKYSKPSLPVALTRSQSSLVRRSWLSRAVPRCIAFAHAVASRSRLRMFELWPMRTACSGQYICAYRPGDRGASGAGNPLPLIQLTCNGISRNIISPGPCSSAPQCVTTHQRQLDDPRANHAVFPWP